MIAGPCSCLHCNGLKPCLPPAAPSSKPSASSSSYADLPEGYLAAAVGLQFQRNVWHSRWQSHGQADKRWVCNNFFCSVGEQSRHVFKKLCNAHADMRQLTLAQILKLRSPSKHMKIRLFVAHTADNDILCSNAGCHPTCLQTTLGVLHIVNASWCPFTPPNAKPEVRHLVVQGGGVSVHLKAGLTIDNHWSNVSNVDFIVLQEREHPPQTSTPRPLQEHSRAILYVRMYVCMYVCMYVWMCACVETLLPS